MWYKLYKTAAAPQLNRGLLMRAVACRIQELASGGLRPEVQHQLHQIASGCSKPDGSRYACALG